jgi:hypothetical protein
MKDCVVEHVNGFRHFDPLVEGLKDFDLGIKFHDNPAPPPTGSLREPGLFVFVSVFQPSLERDLGTIHYCRSRTFLQDGLPRDGRPSSPTDRAATVSAILSRLVSDVASLAGGDLTTSETDPIGV